MHPDIVFFGEGMVGRHDHNQLIDPDRFAIEFVIGLLGQGDNRKFHFVIGDRAAGILRIHEMQVQVNLRITDFEIA